MQRDSNQVGGGFTRLNLCRPDGSKSCAACCGLYNVPDATGPELTKRLQARTLLFQQTQRSADAIQEYQMLVRSLEAVEPIDPAIHVCEFTGFLDRDAPILADSDNGPESQCGEVTVHRERENASESRWGRLRGDSQPGYCVVGCQLHPSAAGNNGIDWRGLCYYGSMACKAFFCPAWKEIPPRLRGLLVATIDDWHLYGLVITDVEYVLSVFRLIESALRAPIRCEMVRSGPSSEILKRMLAWKDSWPFAGSSTYRRNRYHFKGESLRPKAGAGDSVQRLLDCLRFTYGTDGAWNGAADLVQQTVKDFERAYSLSP